MNVITALNFPIASCPHCIPVVVLKNCKPEFLQIYDLSKRCFGESCFPDCWKVSPEVPTLCL